MVSKESFIARASNVLIYKKEMDNASPVSSESNALYYGIIVYRKQTSEDGTKERKEYEVSGEHGKIVKFSKL